MRSAPRRSGFGFFSLLLPSVVVALVVVVMENEFMLYGRRCERPDSNRRTPAGPDLESGAFSPGKTPQMLEKFGIIPHREIRLRREEIPARQKD